MKDNAICGLLGTLESVTAALKERDFASAAARIETALQALRTRPIDAIERMILGKILWRVRETWKSAEGPVFLAVAIRSLDSRVAS